MLGIDIGSHQHRQQFKLGPERVNRAGFPVSCTAARLVTEELSTWDWQSRDGSVPVRSQKSDGVGWLQAGSVSQQKRIGAEYRAGDR